MITEYSSLLGKIKVIDYHCGETLYDIAENLQVPYKTQPIICLRNGEPVLRKYWDSPVGLSQDYIRFVQIPRGETVKNILRTVALVALSVVVPALGVPGLLGVTSAIGAGLINAGLIIGGTFLINAFLGSSVKNLSTSSSASASPTYSLESQGNRARILNPIPRLYGTHIIYPDFASQPYQSYEDNEQYVYQLFCLGVGEYQVDRINIDKTKLWDSTSGISESFADVQLEIIPPGQKVTLFPSNVITSTEVSGQELRNESISGIASLSGNRVTFAANQPNIEYLSPGDNIHLTAGSTSSSFSTSASFTNGGSRINFSPRGEVANLKAGNTIRLTYQTSVTDENGFPQTTNHVFDLGVTAVDPGNSWIQINGSLAIANGTSVTISFSYIPSSANTGTFIITDKDTTDNLTWVEFGTTFTPQNNFNLTLTLDNWVGPFVVNPNNEGTNQLKFDIILSRGLYYANDKGGLSNASVTYQIQARQIDNLGNPTSNWIDFGSSTITKNTVTPQRITRTFDVSLGRYEVRMRRVDVKNHDARYGNEITWGAVRAFIPDDNIYEDVTLLAIKIRASNQLSSQSSTQINVVESGKVPIWNGSTWSAPQVTSNPAWIAADILRNTVYGASMPDNRIDIAKLLELSAVYNSRGDKFNGVFDTTRTLWEALGSVLTIVRTQPILIAGKVTFVRDQPRSLAKTVITPQSVLKNTFEMTHVLKGEDSADDVIVEFMDEKTWEQTEVQATLPGSTSSQPARISLFGITNLSQAWREGMYYAASNSYRRVIANVSTEADGRLLLKGDPVIVSHDLPQWSQNGFVVDYLEEEKVLVLDREVSFSGDENHIILRRKDGREFGPIDVISNGYSNEVVLETGSLEAVELAQGITLEEVLSIDDEAKRTTYIFLAGAESFAKRFIVVGATMRDINKVDLSLTIDDSRVYAADTGTPPPGVDYLGPGVTPNGPVVDAIYVSQDPFSASDPVTLNVSWNVAAGASNYILQYSIDNVTWSTIYSGTVTNTQVVVNAGSVYLRVAAVGTTLGPWKNYTSNFGTPSLLPGTITGLVVNADIDAGVIEITYSPAPRATGYTVAIYTESTPNSGTFDTLKLSKTINATTVSWNSSEVTSAGGPWGRIEVRVTASNDNGSGAAVTEQVVDIGLGTVNNLSLVGTYNGTEAQIQWSPVSGAGSYRLKFYNNSNTLIRETVVTSNNYYYTNAQLVSDGGPWRSFSVKVNGENANLVGPQSTLTIADQAPPAPSNIASSSPSPGQLNITWDQVMQSDVTGYIVYGSTTSGFTPSNANKIFEGNVLGVSTTGLTSGQSYYFRILTKDSYAGGNGYNISTERTRIIS